MGHLTKQAWNNQQQNSETTGKNLEQPAAKLWKNQQQNTGTISNKTLEQHKNITKTII
ncbi:MAG: hypothetical protein IJY78_05775 [Bacteroidaceae bacterium]|nr:hypothetical protein [Bacteroidaceae bacterium]